MAVSRLSCTTAVEYMGEYMRTLDLGSSSWKRATDFTWMDGQQNFSRNMVGVNREGIVCTVDSFPDNLVPVYAAFSSSET